jgi:hypothetical protein
MINDFMRRFFLIGMLCWGVAAPATEIQASYAACRAAPVPVVLASSWNLGKFIGGAGSQTRIVQICVVFMCVGLFILMRKLC